MLTFGKKINYRPLAISLLIGLFVFTIFSSVFSNVLLGSIIFIIIFLIIFLGYYLPNIPTLFNYWEYQHDEIRYIDFSNKKNRLLGMLIPRAVHFQTIKNKEVQSIDVIGDLNDKFEMPLAIPYSGYLAVMTPAISVANHPVEIRLHLTTGDMIDLSVSRDYAYCQKNTIAKLNKFFENFKNTPINIIRPTDHKVSLS